MWVNLQGFLGKRQRMDYTSTVLVLKLVAVVNQ